MSRGTSTSISRDQDFGSEVGSELGSEWETRLLPTEFFPTENGTTCLEEQHLGFYGPRLLVVKKVVN